MARGNQRDKARVRRTWKKEIPHYNAHPLQEKNQKEASAQKKKNTVSHY